MATATNNDTALMDEPRVLKAKSSETLTKAVLADRLNQALGYNRNQCEALVEAFFEEVSLSCEKGQKVKLSGFGNFNIIDKPSRPGRNPKTGEEKEISARRVVTFKSGGKLKSRVEKLDPKDAGINIDMEDDGE
jgi:integration host factor subunit alpha|tara:strand:- start:7576 stop:7977 length:402 start_codon:yes stop_codon:yes gene_type:complete